LDAGATADASYKIQFENNIYGFDHPFTGLSAGAYHFTILNATGCAAGEKDYTLTEEVCPPIVIANVGITSECSAYGEATVTITTNAHPDHYTFTFDGVTDTTGVFHFILPGTYTLSITSSGGNNFEQQVTVPDLTVNKPAITYVAKNMLCNLGGEVTFTGSGDNTGGYQVKYGMNVYPFGETITSLPIGLNNFTVINPQGCIIDTLNVNIGQDKCNPVVFPNTFTPNGDGINDQFRPNPDANPSSYQLLVYNRWGALVFQSQSANNGWDGRFNGKPAPLGVYYYIATFAMPGTEKKSVSGFVTLIR
jgi:gliding motility-associated-like protein